MKRAISITTIMIFLAFPSISWPQYPKNSAIKLLVPFAPGSTAAQIANSLANSALQTSQTKIVVENISGKGILSGLTNIRSSAPDGYTLGMHRSDLGAVGAFNISFYRPIAMVASEPIAVFVSPEANINNLSDLRSLRRGNPLNVTFITMPAEAAGIKLLDRLGRRMNIYSLTYNIAFQSLLRSEIDLLIAPLGPPQTDAKQPKAIAIFSANEFREIRTASSQEFDIRASLNYAVVAPLETFQDRANFMNNALRRAVNNEDYIKRLKAIGVIAEYSEGTFYKESTMSATNAYCKLCECQRSVECKNKCSKCAEKK